MPVYHVTIHERPTNAKHELYVTAKDDDAAILAALREVRAAVGDDPDLHVYTIDTPRRRRTDLQVGAQP
jgi:hypothetical protein